MELTSNESGNQVDRLPDGDMCHREHKAGRVLRVGGGVIRNQGQLEQAHWESVGTVRDTAVPISGVEPSGRESKQQEASVWME